MPARLVIPSPLGPLTLIAEGGALVALDWGAGAGEGSDPVLSEAARQLEAYFAGRRPEFHLPLRPAGTPFRQRVWSAMRAIPCGRVATYADLARCTDSAPRAVGGACGANPIPIIIPCHRVVAKAGRGGYSGFGGLGTKDWLLAHEAALANAPAS